MSDTLHPDDSLFHPAGNDPWAYESYWFSFFVPDRKLMVYVYPWFRPNLGIAQDRQNPVHSSLRASECARQ